MSVAPALARHAGLTAGSTRRGESCNLCHALHWGENGAAVRFLEQRATRLTEVSAAGRMCAAVSDRLQNEIPVD